ncbi:MAG: hypothetical protein ACRCTJ_00620 [Brevinema sp.]
MEIKIYFMMLVLLFVIACEKSVSVTEVWLDEYTSILEETLVLTEQTPIETFNDINTRMNEKEKELERITSKLSMQQKLEFLSRFYDLKLQYSYNISR